MYSNQWIKIRRFRPHQRNSIIHIIFIGCYYCIGLKQQIGPPIMAVNSETTWVPYINLPSLRWIDIG